MESFHPPLRFARATASWLPSLVVGIGLLVTVGGNGSVALPVAFAQTAAAAGGLGGATDDPAAQPSAWRFAGGASLGLLLAPEEVGREVNATGAREELVALLGDGIATGVRLGVEAEAAGLELSVLAGGRKVRVENEFGVDFPHHGDSPWLWTASALVFPLFFLRGRALGRRLRLFGLGGVGGFLLSMDLDNVDDQTLHHAWQWSVGAGLRLVLHPAGPIDPVEQFVELRVVRHRVRETPPLHGMDALAVTLGLGMH